MQIADLIQYLFIIKAPNKLHQPSFNFFLQFPALECTLNSISEIWSPYLQCQQDGQFSSGLVQLAALVGKHLSSCCTNFQWKWKWKCEMKCIRTQTHIHIYRDTGRDAWCANKCICSSKSCTSVCHLA